MTSWRRTGRSATSAPTACCSSTTRRERAPARRDSYAQPGDDADAFTQFATSNVKAQKQQGFSTVQIKITRGDLTPAQFQGIADIMREYCGGNARTTVQLNMVLRWVRDESLYEVYSSWSSSTWRRRARTRCGTW